MVISQCPWCGSNRVTIVGGPDGNPYNKTRLFKTVCLTCGRIISGGEVESSVEIPTPEKLLKTVKMPHKVLVVEMHASAKGEHKSASMRLPYENAEYWLGGRDYPLSRFHTMSLKDGVFELEGEEFELIEGEPLEFVKVFAAYDAARYPWREEIEIRVKIEYEL
ncbi:MAG: hypothetical protein IJO64_02670 [Clostridia bacterium]|nr:hypothetical protein [Clostridia bacterium]MBQ9847943.1 hypothetical protein [Clostridia bacterium]